MAKSKLDPRVPIAKALYDQGLTFAEIGRKLKIPDSTVRSWNFRYWNPPKPWPRETVLEAERLYSEGKRAVDIAYMLGVPDSTVRRWVSVHGWAKATESNYKKTESLDFSKLESLMIKIEKCLEALCSITKEDLKQSDPSD